MRFTKASFYLFLSGLLFIGCKDGEPPEYPVSQPISEIRVQEKLNGQPLNEQAIDKSPMDMSYYPVDYPVLKMSGKAAGLPVARVIYSRPFKDGREIFGNVVKFGAHWRLGANEATEIEFFQPVTIQRKLIRKGRYIIYCIPFNDKWKIILNNDLFTWGLKIDTTKDVASFDVPALAAEHIYEGFTMEFEAAPPGMNLAIAWDRVKARLPIAY